MDTARHFGGRASDHAAAASSALAVPYVHMSSHEPFNLKAETLSKIPPPNYLALRAPPPRAKGRRRRGKKAPWRQKSSRCWNVQLARRTVESTCLHERRSSHRLSSAKNPARRRRCRLVRAVKPLPSAQQPLATSSSLGQGTSNGSHDRLRV
ncbi:hypothetical protein FH972_021210 [Carpinus fangiana]|uniref:Uncharacterized protein n=1 Tax=Carpinus fangiana TaxID=176857 RepID=A0A5N6KP25_9ROSI|nr:hypothetical protein FH972_021210 [Carpinus fangiana]